MAAPYFFKPDGDARDVGFDLRNPELAAVLRRIAAQGSRGFYEGEIAQAIVDKVRKHPTNPGRMTLADLAGYQPKKRSPICHDHRARGKDLRICGFPPPSSGAIAVGQILGILNDTSADTLSAGERPARRQLAAPVPGGVAPRVRRPRTSTWATRISSSPRRETG